MILQKLAHSVVFLMADIAIFAAFLVAALVHYSRLVSSLPSRLKKKWSER